MTRRATSRRRRPTGRQPNRTPARQPTAARQSRVRLWLAAKKPLIRFIAIFAVLVLLINVLLLARMRETPVILGFLSVNAQMAGAVLDLFGENTTVLDRLVSGKRYTLEVSHGCDAVQPTALFIAAVIATPARWRRRLIGIMAGACVLLALNFVRIVSLYYVGVYAERYFQFVHVELWGAAFILLAIVLWLAWANWATRPAPPVERGAKPDESTGD